MSCTHCSTKFNFFHKELGCSNCGISLCSNCLKQKCIIPSKGSGLFKVCNPCYKKLTTEANTSNVIYPPDKYLKRLENLENPAAPPITVYKDDPRLSKLKDGLSSADQDIADRLAKLKEKQTVPPSDTEIRERLAKLKGSNIDFSKETKLNYAPDMRSDQEKVDSLLEEFGSEININKFYDPSNDLIQRLVALKGEKTKEPEPKITYDADIDSEEEIDKITRKIVGEVSLDERCPIDTFKKSTDDDLRSSPELPWCVICNNDAVYRCLDCSNDLYCSSCNTEIHKSWGETDHKIVPYKQGSGPIVP